MKEKLSNDSKKNENERKIRSKEQFKQLSDRQLMHFKRKSLYGSLIGLNEAEGISLETLKKYGLDHEDHQSSDSTVTNLPDLGHSPQKLGCFHQN